MPVGIIVARIGNYWLTGVLFVMNAHGGLEEILKYGVLNGVATRHNDVGLIGRNLVASQPFVFHPEFTKTQLKCSHLLLQLDHD
jgi:hypothetical protein